MTVSYSATVKKAKLDAVETTIGAAPELRIYNGTPPANADTALSGNTLIAKGTLPSDWMAAAGNTGNTATKAKSGTWTVTGEAAAGAGTDGTFYRIYDAAGPTCHEQGIFGDAGTEDMVADNANISTGQVITVNTFTKTAGN